jgi:hypothetical protein
MDRVVFSLDFRKYKNLSVIEYMAIIDYMDGNDPAAIAAIIKSGKYCTESMRGFIADIITGEVKRSPRKKASKHNLNYVLYRKILELLSEGQPLTDNRAGGGAAATVANEFGVSEDVAIKAYYEIKDEHDQLFKIIPDKLF